MSLYDINKDLVACPYMHSGGSVQWTCRRSVKRRSLKSWWVGILYLFISGLYTHNYSCSPCMSFLTSYVCAGWHACSDCQYSCSEAWGQFPDQLWSGSWNGGEEDCIQWVGAFQWWRYQRHAGYSKVSECLTSVLLCRSAQQHWWWPYYRTSVLQYVAVWIWGLSSWFRHETRVVLYQLLTISNFANVSVRCTGLLQDEDNLSSNRHLRIINIRICITDIRNLCHWKLQIVFGHFHLLHPSMQPSSILVVWRLHPCGGWAVQRDVDGLVQQ